MHHFAADDTKDAKPEGTGTLAEQLVLDSRFVLIFGEIDDVMARRTCERLILLAQKSDAPIHLLVSSPGGHVESGEMEDLEHTLIGKEPLQLRRLVVPAELNEFGIAIAA